MSQVLYNSRTGPIRLGHKIGVGGEGEVFEVQGRSDLVAKIYFSPPPAERAEKLALLIRLGNERLSKLSAWPVDLLRDQPDDSQADGQEGGQIRGFLMQKINEAEEVHTLHSPKSRLQKFPEASWKFLIYVAANFARAVAAIHEHGFVIGDVNPKNTLVTRKATIYLLDCDSFQVSVEGRTYRCEGGFPEYTPPELQQIPFREVDRSHEHDCFGLAIVIFQLLFMGRHPFSGQFLGAGEMPLERAIKEYRWAYGRDAKTREMIQPPGTLKLEAVPEPMQELFRRAFLSSSGKDRPQAREWVESLESLSRSLTRCELHSGHDYYREVSACPWCEIETRAHLRLFNFMLGGAGQTGGPFRLDEIWREIKDVGLPSTAQIYRDNWKGKISPSQEVAAFARRKRIGLRLAMIFSIVVGIMIAQLTELPGSVLLFILAAIGTRRIAEAEYSRAAMIKPFWRRRQAHAVNPLVQKIQNFKNMAESNVQQIEMKWEKEAGNGRFLTKLDELQFKKETYENLPQLRKQKLEQMEARDKTQQCYAFLNRHQLCGAEIDDIGVQTKALLHVRGIKTAADLTEQQLYKVRELSYSQAKKLLRWREDVERKFVFDPRQSFSSPARIEVEKEIESVRIRLEHELSSGALYLRRVKNEIEDSRLKLHPLLMDGHRSLAQAERDWEVATKSERMTLAIVVLLFSFLFGLALKHSPDRNGSSSAAPNGHETATTGPPPPLSHPDLLPRTAPRNERPAGEVEWAQSYYKAGLGLSRKGDFSNALSNLKQAVGLDPQLSAAHEELGYVLFRLGYYEQSIEASKQAIRLNNSFGSFYNLGLVYVAQKRWDGAKEALQRAVAHCNRDLWIDSYTTAYDNLGLSLARLEEIKGEIEVYEIYLNHTTQATFERFELANLYLWVNNNKAAIEQYRLLKVEDETLAQELKKLMIKHGVHFQG